MTIDIDVRDRHEAPASEPALFSFTGWSVGAAEPARPTPSYSEVDLSDDIETRDFDPATIAIVAGIVTFKLSMLALLLVSL